MAQQLTVQDAARQVADRGPARARQVRWVAGELERAAALLPELADDWADPAALASYLELAGTGRLRRRPPQRPSTDATQRIRRDCLVLLTAAAGRPTPLARFPRPRPRPPAPRHSARLFTEGLLGASQLTDPGATTVRTAAVVCLVSDTGARVGELTAMTIDDLTLGPWPTVLVRPRPPAGRHTWDPQTRPLSPRTVAALQRWLELRAQVVRPRVAALWVSVHPDHDGKGVRRPAGLPLQPRGLARSYVAAIERSNRRLFGAPGFEPLPRTLGALRAAALRTRDR